MRILQFLLFFRRTTLAEEVVKSFGFLWGHLYTSRMKPESKGRIADDFKSKTERNDFANELIFKITFP